MSFNVVVSQTSDGDWLVRCPGVRRSDAARMTTFRCRGHALALGRALAYSRRIDLFLVGQDGAVSQSRASMTYPLLRD